MKNIIKKMVVLALMIALNIVLSRNIAIINLWNFKISFTFVTLIITGYLYGPLYSALVGGIGDFIGALLFPIGPYNPLFTITAILSGLVFGMFYEKNIEYKYIFIECPINQIFVSLLLNTYFIALVYDKSYLLMLSTRIIQTIIMIVVQIPTIMLLRPFLKDLKRRI